MIVKFTLTKKQKDTLFRIIITIVLLVIFHFIELDNKWLNLLLYLIPYFLIGYDILIKAIKGIFKGQIFDENFLMAVATVGAMALGDYQESVAVMLFYQIGELFQSYAINKSRKNISDLMNIRPDYANILVDGKEVQVSPEEIEIGDEIVINVGEKVPIDGIITRGSSSLNTSALTGESRPREVDVGDEIQSGSINMESPLIIKTTKSFEESTASKILDLVENASSNKSESENFISKFAKFYTPVVCFGALALTIIPPLFSHFVLGGDYNFSEWLFRALTFLVISCPCALVISIPLSFFGGIGGASKEGILIKGSNYLEQLAKTKEVALDKTGTVTLGIFEVSTIHNSNITPGELLEYAALAEAYSPHPIAQSIIKEYGKKLDYKRIKKTKEIHGKGLMAIIDDKEVFVGNETLMNEHDVEVIPCNDEGAIVHVAINNQYKGHIHIGDKIKTTSKQAIDELKKINIKKIVMLTGDDAKIANNVADELGIDEVYAELLPQDKVNIIEQLLKEKEPKETLVYVGDGLNDAPCLLRADIGMAMGALGSDAAIEAADIVLMDDDPMKISKAIKIAKKCMRIVYENIIFAIFVKVVCLILSAMGITNMWLAIFADVGVMVIAVINAIRALNVKNL